MRQAVFHLLLPPGNFNKFVAAPLVLPQIDTGSLQLRTVFTTVLGNPNRSLEVRQPAGERCRAGRFCAYDGNPFWEMGPDTGFKKFPLTERISADVPGPNWHMLAFAIDHHVPAPQQSGIRFTVVLRSKHHVGRVS